MTNSQTAISRPHHHDTKPTVGSQVLNGALVMTDLIRLYSSAAARLRLQPRRVPAYLSNHDAPIELGDEESLAASDAK